MGGGREVRGGVTGPRQGSLASRGTLGGTKQLIETAIPKLWVRWCPCCWVCDSSPSPLCPSVSLSLCLLPLLSYVTENNETSSSHGFCVFFPV